MSNHYLVYLKVTCIVHQLYFKKIEKEANVTLEYIDINATFDINIIKTDGWFFISSVEYCFGLWAKF